MNKISQQFIIFSLLIMFSGCALVEETTKTLWGSSTRALEDARVDAANASFTCSYDECFDAVVKLANTVKDRDTYKYNDLSSSEPLKTEETSTGQTYDIFIQDRVKGLVVVVGLKGNVNTTEVGIFFSRIKPQETKIEISSLSSSAKAKVVKMVFAEMGRLYTEVK